MLSVQQYVLLSQVVGKAERASLQVHNIRLEVLPQCHREQLRGRVVVPAGLVECTHCRAQNGRDGLRALVREGQMLEDRQPEAEEWDSTGPNMASYKGCIRMMGGRLAEVVPGATTAPVVVGMNHRRFDVVDAAALERCDCGGEVRSMSVDLHREDLEPVEVATCWCGSMQNNGIVLQRTL